MRFGLCGLPMLAVALAVGNNEASACDALVQEHAEVSEIYPTADVLPDNLLRIYVYFSKLMRRDRVFDAVSLKDADGEAVPGVFFKNRFDLWSPDSMRLTLLLDPGRVKTGLEANAAMDRALTAGRSYSLVIHRTALDACGQPLKQTFTKDFTVTTSDLSIPDIGSWTVFPPRRNTREPVRITLNDRYDHVSLAYRLRVKDPEGRTVPGEIDVATDESEWHFTPQSPWKEREYVLDVDPTLEDLAGNRLTGLFDDPTGASRVTQAAAPSYRLEFETTE